MPPRVFCLYAYTYHLFEGIISRIGLLALSLLTLT